MSNIVDARGKPCPQPVILTRQALSSGQPVTTIVDNDTAVHNVSRMAEKAGCAVSVDPRDDGIYLHITPASPGNGVPAPAIGASIKTTCESTSGSLVVVVPGDTMGRGDAELGGILIRSFFHALGETQPLPDTIVFFNSGVKLVVEGSPVVEDLRALAGRGVEVLACGTCLDFFGLKARLEVGEISNMYTIAETLCGAGRVVSL